MQHSLLYLCHSLCYAARVTWYTLDQNKEDAENGGRIAHTRRDDSVTSTGTVKQYRRKVNNSQITLQQFYNLMFIDCQFLCSKDPSSHAAHYSGLQEGVHSHQFRNEINIQLRLGMRHGNYARGCKLWDTAPSGRMTADHSGRRV